MGFIKICSFCGTVNKAEQRVGLKKCQNKNCGRSLEHISSMTEAEYEAREGQIRHIQEKICDSDSGNDIDNEHNSTLMAKKSSRFYLVNKQYDIKLEIPGGRSIIGREYIGKEEFKNFLSISRRHLEVDNNGIYLTVKDVSSFGTYLDGSLILKDEEQYVAEGATISLHIYDFQVVRERE